MNKILDKMAYGPTVFLGFVFFLMPFFPEPHIIEKIKILNSAGTMEPRAWVDIVLHLIAGLLALTKHFRHRELLSQGIVAEGDRNAVPVKEKNQDQASGE
ncbi:MAG: hypothetical protein JKY92_07140 [Magnetovibrio sp.]|nr:hypothetical protein [Magnetovibrio sp.]